MFIHLIPGGVSSYLWLSDIFVSQVCLRTTMEFLVFTEKFMNFESTISMLFYAAP